MILRFFDGIHGLGSSSSNNSNNNNMEATSQDEGTAPTIGESNRNLLKRLHHRNLSSASHGHVSNTGVSNVKGPKRLDGVRVRLSNLSLKKSASSDAELMRISSSVKSSSASSVGSNSSASSSTSSSTTTSNSAKAAIPQKKKNVTSKFSTIRKRGTGASIEPHPEPEPKQQFVQVSAASEEQQPQHQDPAQVVVQPHQPTHQLDESLTRISCEKSVSVILRLSQHAVLSLQPENLNAPASDEHILTFSGKAVPGIRLEAYLARQVHYLNEIFQQSHGLNSVGMRSLVIASIYIDRLLKAWPKLRLTARNVHRLHGMAIIIAVKMTEDELPTSKYFANMAGVTIADMGRMCTAFCERTQYSFVVREEEVRRRYELLLGESFWLEAP